MECLQLNNTREIWKGLKTTSGHSKNSGRSPVFGEREWANKLNLFDSAHPVHQSIDQSVFQLDSLWPWNIPFWTTSNLKSIHLPTRHWGGIHWKHCKDHVFTAITAANYESMSHYVTLYDCMLQQLSFTLSSSLMIQPLWDVYQKEMSKRTGGSSQTLWTGCADILR